jgi:hypothetical protein
MRGDLLYDTGCTQADIQQQSKKIRANWKDISIYVYPEKELRGLSPNFSIHVSVSDLYIPTIGSPIFLQQNMQRSQEYINRTQKHEWRNWDGGRAVPFLGLYVWIFGVVSLQCSSRKMITELVSRTCLIYTSIKRLLCSWALYEQKNALANSALCIFRFFRWFFSCRTGDIIYT